MIETRMPSDVLEWMKEFDFKQITFSSVAFETSIAY